MKIPPDGIRIYKEIDRKLCFGRHLSVVLCRQRSSNCIYWNLKLVAWKIQCNC